MDKLSYALGMSMGQNFLHSGVKDLNVEDFAKAVAAIYAGEKTEITFDEAKQVINNYFTELEEKQRKQNKEIGEKFLEENKTKEGVKVTASGLQYKILKRGDGLICPQKDDQVTVHYTGTLVDGTKFDSSLDRGEPTTFGVTQVIPGWVEGLQLMHEGDEFEFYIPSNLAYGSHGTGPITPDSALIFYVKLIKITRKSGIII